MRASTVLVVASFLVVGVSTALAADGEPGPAKPPPRPPATTRSTERAVTIFGEPADPSRRTDDNIPLPVVAEQKVRIALPIIGDALGAAPESVIGGFEALVARQSHRRIASLFQYHNLDAGGQTGVGAMTPPGDTLWVFGPFRAAAVTLRLKEGRVVRLALHYPSLPQADFRALVSKLQPYVDGREIDVSAGAAARRKGSRVTLTGTKTQKLPIPVHCSIYWREGPNPQAPRDTCVVFEVDPIEWHLLYHPTDEHTAKAMRSAKPMPGMTRTEVVLAVGALPWRESPVANGAGTVINWHQYSDYWKEDRVVARATFDAEGKLTDFKTWSADAKDAPRIR